MAFSTGWAPERDYYPPWVAVPGLTPQNNLVAEKGVSIPIARFAPQDSFIVTTPIEVEKRNYITNGTILVQIEKNPFTACEMIRPKGHESFYCFVDGNGDGSFEGVYHLFSNSYFLLAGWTNRAPETVKNFSYRQDDPRRLNDFIQIEMKLVRRDKGNYKFRLDIASKSRKDFWIYMGDLYIKPEFVGKQINVMGATIKVDRFDSLGPTLSINPAEEGYVAHFNVPKQMPIGWYAGGTVDGNWTPQN